MACVLARARLVDPMSAQHEKAVPVRAHRFAAGPEYTLGIEEELMLLDAGDLALTPGVERLVAAVGDARVKPELMQCQVELATSPQATIAAAEDELRDLRSRVVRAGAQLGLGLAAAGTHPFSLPESQPLTVRDRYRELAAAVRYPLRREACFGMHVHVAVGGANKALRVMEAMLGDLPLLLAASVSSPFWRGEPTGLHSTRTAVFQSLPRSGLPPVFGSFEEYACGVERLVRAGALPDHSYLWWDVRPHPRFGTIEVRILDVQPRAGDSIALAGLVQALVRHYGRRDDLGERFADADRLLVAENRWLAARHGLHARFVDLGADTCVPARRALEELLDRVAGDAAALDAGDALDRIASILRDGTSADRQLALYRHGASLETVVRALALETRG
jgi:glutamate---cysteine ligase / carboxylate-amine ligase